MARKKSINVGRQRIAEIYQSVSSTYLGDYEESFDASPAGCGVCGHHFEFKDRIAAAILFDAHGTNKLIEWISSPPSKIEELEGIILCPSCKEVHLVELAYAYPSDPDPKMPTTHAAFEANAFFTS